jgi:hypothetical protein
VNCRFAVEKLYRLEKIQQETKDHVIDYGACADSSTAINIHQDDNDNAGNIEKLPRLSTDILMSISGRSLERQYFG